MNKPSVIIVNGFPGAGKTTLAKRLSEDLKLPLLSRDGIYETLFDALDCDTHGSPPLLAPAAFTFLYSFAGTLLAAGQSFVIEGFFGRPELRSAEFLKLKGEYDFEPFQIMCRADGRCFWNAIMRAWDQRNGIKVIMTATGLSSRATKSGC